MKSNGIDKWALRCNASSGNLQPTESYVILPPVDECSFKTTISHYKVKNHSLEILEEVHFDWQNLPKESFFLFISSVTYREVWKYEERAFRYVCLDVGHALRAAQISAKTLGWNYKVIDNFNDKELPGFTS